MKTSRLFALSACTLLALSVACAQISVNPPRGKRFATSNTAAGTTTTGTGTASGTSTLPANTAQTMKAAFQSLKSALPIYDGDRARAMKLLERAYKILEHAAHSGKGNHAGAAHAQRQLPQVKSEGHNKSRYTAQQLAQSQAAMQAGLADIQSIASAVASVNANAGADLSQAMQDIQAGIAIHANG